MSVTFHKMHGLGNDFVVLDLREQNFLLNSTIACQLAERNTGVGCDQILVLRDATVPQHLASFEIWNSDGSRAEQCGNGVRCLGLYLNMRGEVGDELFKLGGPAGEVEIRCLANSMIQVNMGKPGFEPHDIPVTAPQIDGWYQLNIEGNHYRVGAATMGNPHALMLVDDVNAVSIEALGKSISQHPDFPNGCNAGFAEVTDRNHIRLRVFERGAEETNACGSGACAAMSILHRAELVDKNLKVTQAGGLLIIEWTGGDSPVMMTGTATYVFKGKLI